MSNTSGSGPAPQVQPGTYDDRGQHALDAALDWTKVSTGLATGALVFGIGLSNSASTSLPWIRVTLALAWTLFFVAVVTGVFAQASLPILMHAADYDLENPNFTYPARIHQVSFLGAILLLSAVLIRLLFDQPATDVLVAPTPVRALTLAEQRLSHSYVLDEVTAINLIKAVDASNASLDVWQIQFKVTCKDAKGQPKHVNRQYLVEAASGSVEPSGEQSCT